MWLIFQTEEFVKVKVVEIWIAFCQTHDISALSIYLKCAKKFKQNVNFVRRVDSFGKFDSFTNY